MSEIKEQTLYRQPFIAKALGKQDRRAGKTYAENPYKEPELRGAWQQGWREGVQ